MGWDGTYTNKYKNGKVDVKGFLDEEYSKGCYSVLKSSMVGSIYYAAVKKGDDVFALVCQTSTRKKDGCNVFFKAESEEVGPGYYDCPKSIMKLLTPTTDEYALAWRGWVEYNREKKAREKQTPDSLDNLPIGSVIKFTQYINTTAGFYNVDVVLRKTRLAYGKRSATYWVEAGCRVWRKKKIPTKFVILQRGEKMTA